jgi:hypothetical protein
MLVRISLASLVQDNGWQRSFQPSMKVPIAVVSSLTEANKPRRMACWVMIEKNVPVGDVAATVATIPTGAELGKPHRCCPTVWLPSGMASRSDEDVDSGWCSAHCL